MLHLTHYPLLLSTYGYRKVLDNPIDFLHYCLIETVGQQLI